MYNIGTGLKMTRRKQADMRAAVEITGAFKNIVPEDPARYDFSLTRLGIRDDADLEGFIKSKCLIDFIKCGVDSSLGYRAHDCFM